MEARGNKDSPSLALALRYVAKAREMRPSWPPLPLLAARVYELQGKEDLMLESYLQAIKAGDADVATVSRAVQLLGQRQRYGEASELGHVRSRGKEHRTIDDQLRPRGLREPLYDGSCRISQSCAQKWRASPRQKLQQACQ
jgi:hypothetical protein